jgi:hypothetical protein
VARRNEKRQRAGRGGSADARGQPPCQSRCREREPNRHDERAAGCGAAGRGRRIARAVRSESASRATLPP